MCVVCVGGLFLPHVKADVWRMQKWSLRSCCCQLNLQRGKERKFRGGRVFLSVGGRDLVLDLADLLLLVVARYFVEY